ncbi:ABC transporter ATP-binding protein [Rugosimonospora africana]|uniref:ABC transporter ATP-binding protein n=1 Tax=Rugosimonospora africana TaxID=556532 RepID=UPI001EF2F5C1|nr:ABC transporter ATP-binding protein [Rugosimonospora africana]
MAAACALALVAAPATVAWYVVLTLTAGLAPVAAAWLTKLALDNLVQRGPLGSLFAIVGGLAAVGVIAAVQPPLTQYLRAELDRRVGLLAQNRLFTAVDGFVGIGPFENPVFLDRLRLAQQSGGTTPNQVVDGVLGIGRAALTIAGFLSSLLVLGPLMAVAALASGLPALVAELAMSRRRARMYWRIGPAERREAFYGSLLSTVEAAKEIRLFGIGTFLRERMLAERRTANAAKRAVDRRDVLQQAGLGFIAAVVCGAGLMWAVSAARAGRLSVGDVTVFVAAVAGMQGAMATLANQVARAHHGLLMFDHYRAVVDSRPDLPIAAPPASMAPLREGIEFQDVWFRYSDQHPWVLRGVNLRIPSGGSCALVGLNGAGKSTLVKLLCRLYDPTRGVIRWDGRDLREVDPAELRRRIGAVFQDYMEYDLTAAENIGLGDVDGFGDRERIETAGRQSGIHDKLAGLPQGYDTLLTRMFFMESERDDPETGVVLSGGQWQRIALARALMRNRRDLMILDEPSAGLDAEAEHEVHASLRRLRSGQTSLLISHRLGAVRDADLIVVLSDGSVVELGDHTTLMRRGGEYARLFALQASGYQPRDELQPSVSG